MSPSGPVQRVCALLMSLDEDVLVVPVFIVRVYQVVVVEEPCGAAHRLIAQRGRGG